MRESRVRPPWDHRTSRRRRQGCRGAAGRPGRRDVVARHPVDEIDVVVDAPLLHGGSAEAAFWTATFTSARPRLAPSSADHEDVIALLAGPTFWTPFVAVVCVSCPKKSTERHLWARCPSGSP